MLSEAAGARLPVTQQIAPSRSGSPDKWGDGRAGMCGDGEVGVCVWGGGVLFNQTVQGIMWG